MPAKVQSCMTDILVPLYFWHIVVGGTTTRHFNIGKEEMVFIL